jgi:3-deoxy-D-manno-octulosonic acid (KDO) 8-phosphate synthase
VHPEPEKGLSDTATMFPLSLLGELFADVKAIRSALE